VSALSPRDKDCYVARPVANLHGVPGGPRERQLRYGEAFAVEFWEDGMAFGTSPDTGHSGWIGRAALAPAHARDAPTHRVNTRQTHAYSRPAFKSSERMALPHLSRLAVSGEQGRFLETEIGWVPAAHLSARLASDPVAVAELYLGAPYLWGGNSIWGLDCSGLVHAALLACGQPCPSDSRPQERALGTPLAPDASPQRGDLIFWKGHVAWVADPGTLLHANVHHMAVAYEPLQAAISRIAAQGDGPVTARKRLKGLT